MREKKQIEEMAIDLCRDEFCDVDEDCCELEHDQKKTDDVVDVVRCKDCKHRGKPTCGMSYYDGAEKFPAHIKDNDYCSYGERR